MTCGLKTTNTPTQREDLNNETPLQAKVIVERWVSNAKYAFFTNSPELHVGQVKSAATLKYIRFSGNLLRNTCHQPDINLHHAQTLESQRSTGDKRTAGQRQPSWCRYWHSETCHQPSLLVVFSKKVDHSQKPNHVKAKWVQIRITTKDRRLVCRALQSISMKERCKKPMD